MFFFDVVVHKFIWKQYFGRSIPNGIGIAVFFAFIVDEDDIIAIAADLIGCEDGDFSAAAGGIDNVLRDGEARDISVQRADELDPLLHRCPEMGRAANGIALQKIVRFHVDFEQAVEEVNQGLCVVVDLF